MDSEFERMKAAHEAREAAREQLRVEISDRLRGRLDDILGREHGLQTDIGKAEILPGLPAEGLDDELLTDIMQLLALLHEDGSWARRDKIAIELEFLKERSGLGESEPDDGSVAEFSGNDKYGLAYGIVGMGVWGKIPESQRDAEGDRLEEAWYVSLFNRYLDSYPDRMLKITKAIADAGLPLQPHIQMWLKDKLREESSE